MKFTLDKFICFVLVSCCVVITLAQLPANADESATSDGGGETKPAEFNPELSSFKKLYLERRKEHVKAVEQLRNKDSYEKKYQTIKVIFDAMIKVFKSQKETIDNVLEIINKNEEFVFKNVEMRNDVSSVLENIAIFSDIALQIPEITHRIFKRKETLPWKEKFVNILHFAEKIKFLLDDTTVSTIDLVFQELNIIPRSPNYINKYSTDDQGQEKNNNKKIKKNKSRRTGPQMARQDL